MEAADITKLLNRVQTDLPDSPIRLVLTIRSAPDNKEVLDPAAYSSRMEYRRALIHQKARSSKTAPITELMEKFNAIGLKTKVAPLSGMIIAEGFRDQLAQALREDAIVAAEADTQIRLIRPR